MAVHPVPQNTNTVPIASPHDSDYGSDLDIDDDTADQLFSQVASQLPVKKETSQLEQSDRVADLEEDVFTHNFSVRLAKLQQSLDGVEESRVKMEEIVQGRWQHRRGGDAAGEVAYDQRERSAFSPSNAEEPEATAAMATPAEEPRKLKKRNNGPDTRSPLQRFKARRPLSVTNLVSPSWCEQQYLYNLSHHGRIPQTKAMTAGTTTHKELEEQVHVEVPVEVVSREDRFGLRLWNTIQGLRALRTTGLTRELEVWGAVEGEVVNGIVDEITVECPDGDMEARVLEELQRGARDGKANGTGKGKKEAQLAPDQRTLTDFLTGSSRGGSTLESHPSSFISALHATQSATGPSTSRPTPTYYLKDIKTTTRPRPPTHPAYTRGPHLQLMLYHRILSQLAANEVPAQQVFDRYGLDAEAHFSDKFIAELANLDLRAFASVVEGGEEDERDLPFEEREQQVDPLTELLEHNTLSLLWTLLVRELQRTFPPASPPPPSSGTSIAAPHSPSLSPLLTLEYRNPTTSALLALRSFALNPAHLDDYLRSEVSWWRGERATVGVSLEDAWKCGWCAFADDCSWRAEKVEEGLERVKMRKEGARVAPKGKAKG